MKKLLLVLIVTMFSAHISAQTIVGTDPENKNVVLEEFTGIYCGFCPDGHAIAQAIYDNNPDDVVLINIHQGGYADPNPGHPDYRTPWGDAIAGQSGLLGYPAGTVNRHLFPGYSQGGGTAQSRGTWSTTSNMVMAEPSYLNIELEATIVTSTRQLVVYVEVYYTADSPEEKNYLNVAILQNNVVGYQANGGSNYNHMHMLRDMITGQWGVEIEETTEGSLYTGTFTYELPEDYNDIDVVMEDLDIVGFVAEGHQEIISGNMAEITLVDSYEYDAAFLSTYVPQDACTGELNAEVLVKNYGTEDLTSLEFTYYVNEGEPATFSWTGNLSQFDSEVVALPTYLFEPTDNNYVTINSEMPSGHEDQLPRNGMFDYNSHGSDKLPQDCFFGLETPDNPEDLTWNIVDTEGNVIAEGGPYSSGGFKVKTIHFPEAGCYSLTVNDASGSGLNNGLYVFLDQGSNVLWTGKPFKEVAKTEVAYDITIDIPENENIHGITVYPNPADVNSNIQFSLNNESSVSVNLYDITGKQVVSIFEGTMEAGEQELNFDVSGLTNGIYIVQFVLDGEIHTQKLNIK